MCRDAYEILSQSYYLFVISRGLLELNEFTNFVIGLFFFGLLGWWVGGGKENFRIPALSRIPFQETYS